MRCADVKDHLAGIYNNYQQRDTQRYQSPSIRTFALSEFYKALSYSIIECKFDWIFSDTPGNYYRCHGVIRH